MKTILIRLSARMVTETGNLLGRGSQEKETIGSGGWRSEKEEKLWEVITHVTGDPVPQSNRVFSL